MAKEMLQQRKFLRNEAKKNIETLQSENRKTYNRRRKKASFYKEGDLVAIQRTQFGAGPKLRPKFLGFYKITKVNSKDRYEVEKVGQHEGPNSNTSAADLMKHFYA
ncbi:uncharacterized protein TNCV_1112541 [Trichonephila clavipes]|uniref:Uncharacterized protein n=1 Tax=Trichonephila clavipes TaxID=2585209 RepID=A0A8X6V228_TRICX|nr:uncharacterized protein TNCV_1112541 [Trichonephila clavipes]